MSAKPIIDMIGGVRDLTDADVAEPALEAFGYVRAVHRTDAVLFNKGSAAQHTHHLHLTVPGSDLWRERPRSVTRYATIRCWSSSTPS